MKPPERSTRTKEGFGNIMAFGKGDRQRERDPRHCTKQQFEENWDRTFGTPEDTKNV